MGSAETPTIATVLVWRRMLSMSMSVGRRLVAERRGAVADPFPELNSPSGFGPVDEVLGVEVLGVDADRTDQIAATGLDVAGHQILQRRAAVARRADGDAGH